MNKYCNMTAFDGAAFIFIKQNILQTITSWIFFLNLALSSFFPPQRTLLECKMPWDWRYGSPLWQWPWVCPRGRACWSTPHHPPSPPPPLPWLHSCLPQAIHTPYWPTSPTSSTYTPTCHEGKGGAGMFKSCVKLHDLISLMWIEQLKGVLYHGPDTWSAARLGWRSCEDYALLLLCCHPWAHKHQHCQSWLGGYES